MRVWTVAEKVVMGGAVVGCALSDGEPTVGRTPETIKAVLSNGLFIKGVPIALLNPAAAAAAVRLL